jgi:calcineurin-like phosphoesterase family protein
MRYVIGDTHFGHENIIEYCQRPFSNAEEMNNELVRRWNETVSDDDTVIHLGDVRHHPDPKTSAWWLDELNGDIMLVRGNHDGDVGQNAPFHTVTSCTIQHGKYQFYVEHEPVGFSGWQIHGHSHNNDKVNFGFINRASQRVNVSVELINYEPLSLDKLVRFLERSKRYDSIENARKNT